MQRSYAPNVHVNDTEKVRNQKVLQLKRKVMNIEESKAIFIHAIQDNKTRTNRFKVHKDSIKRKPTKSTIDLKKGKLQSKRNYFYFKRYFKKEILSASGVKHQ